MLFLKNKFNKYNFINYIILILAIIISYFSFTDISIWWDEAVYIGMGKYIATGGGLGMWEVLRPPLLPIFFAVAFWLKIPLIIFGKIILIFSYIGSLLITYKISESIKKNSGFISTILLGTMPIFFLYSRVPMTDIISVFFGLLSINFLLKEKYFLVGIISGFTFLLRFPQILVFISILIFILFFTYNNKIKLWILAFYNKTIYILIGFIVIIGPYFILNYFFYGDPFVPFKTAKEAIEINDYNTSLYNLGNLFYFKKLFLISPFLLLFLLLPYFYLKNKIYISRESTKSYLIISITLFILFMFFTFLPHKELRYSVAFIPYLSILSGVSLLFIYKISKNKKMFVLIFTLIFLFYLHKSSSYYKDIDGYSYSFLNKNYSTLDGSYLSTTPIPAVFDNVKIPALFFSRKSFINTFDQYKDSIKGVIIKDCDIFCINKTTNICNDDVNFINNKLVELSYTKILSLEVNKCNFIIYNK